MYISRLQIGNYKSFHQPGTLELTVGFNIISGQNNSGKTALLEALGLNFGPKPHRSTKTLPARDTIPDKVSRVDVDFTLTPSDVTELLRATGGGAYRIFKPALDCEFARSIGFVDDSIGSVSRLLNAVWSQDQLTFKFRIEVREGQPASVSALEYPSYGLYPAQRSGPGGGSAFNWTSFNVDPGGQFRATGQHGADNSGMDFGLTLAQAGAFQRHIYRFAAERMNVGRGPHGAGTQLAQNASNLPEVLNQLQHNTDRFAELNRTLNGILPQVKQVSVRALPSSQVEVVVWPHDPRTRREDLAVPLSESGTGIGQVLAILYVVMTSDRPQVIIIDEPQSFLHPGAERKLVEFLKANSHHQFIIATHSPTIIAAADPKTITLVRYKDAESTLQQLDAKVEKGIQATLAEVGVRLSDSFGADNILWVEGRTEERCFRLMVERLLKRPLRGMEILGIRQTGDLESRDARKVLEIYRSLAEGASLLPPAIAFILDQECRTEDAKRELGTLSGGRVRFLPRRMYENYLLDPAAITAIVNAIPGFSANPIDAQAIGDAIGSRLAIRAFYCSDGREMNLKTVDGGRVLSEIFNEFSETRVSYEKVRHGIALTEWLIEHDPEELTELRAFLERVLDTAGPAVEVRARAEARISN